MKPGRKPMTDEERRAIKAARMQRLRDRRRAAGLRADGTAPTPKPKRTEEERRAMAVERQKRYAEKKAKKGGAK